MTRATILSEITQILNEVLEQEGVILEESTTAKDIEGWDSLNHAIFIGEVQKYFKVKFVLREVLNLKKVGNICDLILERLQSK